MTCAPWSPCATGSFESKSSAIFVAIWPINRSTKSEKIKNFFIKNRRRLLILVTTIILIIFGYFIYGEIKQKKKLNLADQYNASKINFINGNETNVQSEMIRIVEANDRTYSPLALYFLIDNNIATSNK